MLLLSHMSISETDSEVKVAQSCPTLSNCIVHGILQARILQWVAFPFSRETSQLRDWTQVSLIAGRFFCIWATRETQNSHSQRQIRSQILDLEMFLLNEGVLFIVINQLPYVDDIFILFLTSFFFFFTNLVTNYKLSYRSHLKAAVLFCYSLLSLLCRGHDFHRK